MLSMPSLFKSAALEEAGSAKRLALAALALVLCGCVMPPAGAQGAAIGVSTIRSITLERNCFGCPHSGTLVLNSDGSALFTQAGNARRGTEDQVSRGRISVQDFEALARLAVARGFFDLKDRYEAEGLQDGAWASLRITRGNTDKTVFRREDAGPESLKTLEAAIDALKDRTPFTADRR